MRIRTAVAAVSGAVVLSALAAPAALAAEPRVPAQTSASQAAHAAQAAGGKTAFTASTTGTPYTLDASFLAVKVNHGKNIAVGTTNVVKVPVSFTLTHAADIDIQADDFFAGVELYRGNSFEDSIYFFDSNDATCVAATATDASCTATVEIDPYELMNEDAGTWKAAAFAVAFNGEDPTNPNLDNVGVVVQDPTNTFKLQRYSKLTANASPEPVAKGKTITVTGKLTRANWDTHKYAGYTNQYVQLQYFKKGGTAYSTLKTIKSDSYGNLKTTTTATYDGYYRYYFAGTTTTPAVKSAADFVDVQ
ncbi:hypothetical protein [Streptomyces sp. NK08204]|uniref:hypothetical protein n=1 Tax=Streptomyces sp. NK08204 TaxID=2873260 RepID=UPI001CEDE30A|nr:hypothetical protein [Streptomyces sp. NK08204]